MIKKNNFTMLLLCMLLLFGFSKNVDAADGDVKVGYDASKQISYNKTTGKFVAFYNHVIGGHATTYKYITVDGVTKKAFCSQLDNTIVSKECGSIFATISDTNGEYSLKKRLIAGKVKLLAYEKWSNEWEAYLYATELINAVFKFNGSRNFLSQNSELAKIYEKAVKYVNEDIKYSGSGASKLPSITLTGADYMNTTSVKGQYISQQITLTGLVDNFGVGDSSNANGDTKYDISVINLPSGVSAQICSDAAGKNCQSSVTLTKPKSKSYSFYVKLTGVTSTSFSEVPEVKVNGYNKSKYTTVNLYISKLHPKKCQTLVTTDVTETFKRHSYAYLSLSVPSTDGHTILAYKVSGEGDLLTGADFNLYKANKDDENNTRVGNVLATNSNGSASLRYNVSVQSGQTDDFFNWKYCVQETKSPKGFILKDATICYTPKAGVNKITCIDGNGAETNDNNYCLASYGCDDDYILSGNTCQKSVSSTPTTVLKCPDDTTVGEGEQCDVVSDPVEVDNQETGTTETSCGDSGTLSDTDGKCHKSVAPSPDYVCPNNSTYSNGSCVSMQEANAKCLVNGNVVDNKYCESLDQYMSITQTGNNLVIKKINNRTSTTISKKAATGDDEIPGAVLKICSSKPDKNGECDPVSLDQVGLSCPGVATVKDEETGEEGEESNAVGCTYNSETNTRTVKLRWTSDIVPMVWEGLPIGTYYLIEELPPSGYGSVVTSTEFTIENDGSIKTGSQTSSTGTVIIKNKLNEMTISKQDIATSKEIPGAVITICDAYKNDSGKWETVLSDFGDCSVAVLSDGSSATWTSTDKPHIIKGLSAGTYYLVEQIAPSGYSTAESILFTVNADGTLSDKDGKSLKDSKITMYDKPIKDVKTGNLGVHVIFAVLLFASICGVSSYFFLRKQNEVIE